MRLTLIVALTIGCSVASADQSNSYSPASLAPIGLTDMQLDDVTAGRRNRGRPHRGVTNQSSVANNSAVTTPTTFSFSAAAANAVGQGSTFAASSTFVDGATAVTPLFILSTATASSVSSACTGC